MRSILPYIILPLLLLLAAAACAPAASRAGGGPCELPDTPLLVVPGEYESAPGRADTLRLFSSARPGAYDPLPEGCHPRWSLSAGAPATVDARVGVLWVRPDAPDGARFTLLARVGGREVPTVVRVVDPLRNPLVGHWTQVAWTPCASPSAPIAPAEAIRELRFTGGGRYSVTWLPFEGYTDYAGGYTFDPGSGALRLEVDHVNFLPAGLRLEGRAAFDGEGRLHLEGLWLGSRAADAEPGCGMTFRRQGG